MLAGVVFDAVDVARVEAFWARALGGRTAGLWLRFERAEQWKAGKNRLHLDLAGGSEFEAEVERLIALGASRADIGQDDVPWDVLADPEGNEFCVLRPGHPGLQTDHGLAAICLDIAADQQSQQGAFWASASGWGHVQHFDKGCRLRRDPHDPVSLVMGPPAAPKVGRNRVRLEVVSPDWEPGEFFDPCGNEFYVARA